MCSVLDVSRGGYYEWRKAEESEQAKRRAELMDHIIWHYNDSDGIYGSPRIHKELVKEGWIVSERTVGLIMREKGLRSCMSRKFKVTTTDSNTTCQSLQTSCNKTSLQQNRTKSG